MANCAWYGALVTHNAYKAAEFIGAASYTHVLRWVEAIEARPAVQRGLRVNKSWGPQEEQVVSWGPQEEQVVERHGASDFDATAT